MRQMNHAPPVTIGRFNEKFNKRLPETGGLDHVDMHLPLRAHAMTFGAALGKTDRFGHAGQKTAVLIA